MPKVKKKKIKAKVKKVKAKKIAKAKKVLIKKKIKIKIKPRAKKIVLKKKIKVAKKTLKISVKKTANKKAVKKVEIKNVEEKKIIPAPEYSPDSLFKAKIKVIGIGGGGSSIVAEMGRTLEKATFLVADTDIRSLKNKSGMKYFWFGEEFTHGLGTGVNVDVGRQAAEAVKEKIAEYFKGQDILIFVASLGGGLGSGATQIFAEAAKQFGGITFGIFTMPFKFEGKNKYRVAQNALKSLRQCLNVSLVIPNERIFKVIDESTPITNAFSTVNKSLIGSLESLIDLIYNPGIINIDFADLRTILKGKGNSAFLNTIETSGKDKVEKICQNIFKNPLLQNNGFKAEKILFNIAGSENLSMFEIEKISSHIASANSKAKIIFGISKSNKLKNRIKTTILMTGGEGDQEIEEEIEFVKEKPITIKNKKSVSAKKIPVGKKPGVEKAVKIPFFPTISEDPFPVLPQKLDITEPAEIFAKKTIRRSGVEIKEAEDLQERKRQAQEKEWEIPAFLRKVKFKS